MYAGFLGEAAPLGLQPVQEDRLDLLATGAVANGGEKVLVGGEHLVPLAVQTNPVE